RYRIDAGDAQRVADRGIGRRAATLAEDAGPPAERHDVVHDEEVAGEVLLLDDSQLVLDLVVGTGTLVVAAVAGGRAEPGELAQPTGLGVADPGVAGRDGERRQVRRHQMQVEGALPAQRGGPLDRSGPAGELLGH